MLIFIVFLSILISGLIYFELDLIKLKLSILDQKYRRIKGGHNPHTLSSLNSIMFLQQELKKDMKIATDEISYLKQMITQNRTNEILTKVKGKKK